MKNIKLDAAAVEVGGGEVDPILMNDQTGTSTAMPILPPDEYRLQIVKVEQVRNSKNTGNVLKISLKTMDDCASIGGEPIHPGFPIFHNISITPTPNYTQASINRSLKQLMVAAGFPDGAFFPLDRYAGQVVKAVIKTQKATAEWDESSKISRFVV